MPPRPAASDLRRLLSFLRPYRWTAIAAVLASCVAAGAAAAYAYLIGPLLEAVLTGQPVRLGDVAVNQKDLLWAFPIAVVSVALVKALAQFLQNGLMQQVAQRATNDLRQTLYSRLLTLPPSFFDARHSGDLLSRFTGDVTQVEFALTQAMSSWVKDSLQVIALLGVCLINDARLFVLAFIVLPAAMIPVSRFARSVKKVATRTQGSLGRLNELASESLQNLPVVRAYGGEARMLARFDEEQDLYLSAMKRSLFLRGAFTPTLEVLGIIGVALCIAFGAKAVAGEPELAQKLVSFLAAALLMYQPLKALSGTFAQVMAGLASSGRLFEIADDPPEPDEGEPAGPLTRALELRGVHFRYESGHEALRGVDLVLPAGKRTALVGSSGAGKSTLFSLLLRFADPTGGEILWDGVPYARLRRSSVRAQLGWVPQEPVLFSGTVRDNLRVGDPNATDEQLWESLRRAHADGFVRSFARGLDEEVGERGSRLSGGQRQRLAIARAFLRAPSVLLLDEPTSALDAASEREVQQGLAELMRGRTTLVIAHRLATVRDADLICVLENGQVVERGTHEALTRANGRYAELLRQGQWAEPTVAAAQASNA
ncbi:MAG: ABC transporter ATP-binding protein [Myxococcaceae bacterium]|nr:ABC transporter ATP-binding protein [Myxococcaceae bacterium]